MTTKNKENKKTITEVDAARWLRAANLAASKSIEGGMGAIAASLNNILAGNVPTEAKKRTRIAPLSPGRAADVLSGRFATLVTFGGLPEAAFADAVPVYDMSSWNFEDLPKDPSEK